MKKEIILVPQGKCPLDVLAEMGEQTRNAWIYLHDNACGVLESTADYSSFKYGCEKLTWRKTKDYPRTVIWLEANHKSEWAKVAAISADDIAFDRAANDPENIFFLKMM